MRITNLGERKKKGLSRLLKVTVIIASLICHTHPYPHSHLTFPPPHPSPHHTPIPHNHTHPHTTHPHHTSTLHTPHHTHSTDDSNEAIAQVNSTSQDFYFQTEATRMTSNNASSKPVRACERGVVGGFVSMGGSV